MMVHIHEPEDYDKLVEIIVDNDAYDCVYDDATGDWLVASNNKELIHGDWMLTRDDAIQYVLYRAGVIEEPRHERAPDRTSA